LDCLFVVLDLILVLKRPEKRNREVLNRPKCRNHKKQSELQGNCSTAILLPASLANAIAIELFVVNYSSLSLWATTEENSWRG